MRALGLGDKAQGLGLEDRLESDDLKAVDDFGLSSVGQLLGLFPVDHVHVVHVALTGGCFKWGFSLLDRAVRALGVERIAEQQSIARQLSRIEQVLVIRWKLDREAFVLVDPAAGAVELPKRDP